MSCVATLSDAVARLIHDGDSVFVGGFGHCVPFATAHEMIRQGRRDLTVCRSGADILVDQLIAAESVRRLIFGYVGNPGIGLAHAFRRAVEKGQLELEEWTNFSLFLRLHAGAIGVPFLPTRVLRHGDVRGASTTAVDVVCPFTGEELTAVPALRPDVAIIHAQRADRHGNTQMWGVVGDTVAGALAAERILVTVEEIVGDTVIRDCPDRTILPAYRVDAVCAVPFGSHPSYVQDYYTRDDAAYVAYDALARDSEGLRAFLGDWVDGVADRAEYYRRVRDEGARLASRNHVVEDR